jgi:RNA polymerase sigma-70 factor (ECF subfamily)
MLAGAGMTDDGAGHELLFEQAYRDHYSRIRSFLRVYLGNTAAVDDLAQDTFLQLWLRPQAFDPTRASLRTYLLGIARKKAADFWRKSGRDTGTRAERRTNSEGEVLTMQDALSRMETDLRNVLWLREAEGYSYEELSRIFDIPIGTVRSRLYAAREQLRKIWITK